MKGMGFCHGQMEREQRWREFAAAYPAICAEAHAMNAAGDLVMRFAEEFVSARTPAERGMRQHMRAAARAIWYAP